MSRLKLFVVSSVIIFILERVLPVLVPWPIFIFPVFVILFLLTHPTFASQNLSGRASKDDIGEITYVAVAAVVFDFFSGYTFGFSTLAMLVIALAVFFFKTRLNVDPDAFLSLAIYTVIFVFLYFALLSIKSGPRLIIDRAAVIVIETLIIFVIFCSFWRRGLRK